MIELTDQNFETEIQKSEKPVLVDFYASWCSPCFILVPILEKLSADYKDKVIFTKANLDAVPIVAQKFGIDRIPTVIIFKEGKPLSGFIGLHPEENIKKWIDENLKMENNHQDVIWTMLEEYGSYAKANGFNLNPQKGIASKIMEGLLQNEKKYGKKYCPCRRVTGVQDDDLKIVCPCSFHREELEKEGHCLCRLFVKN